MHFDLFNGLVRQSGQCGLACPGRKFETTGVMGMDAIHIACAEKSRAVLLTTDDDLVKIMKKNKLLTSIHADNPLHWLMEMNRNAE